MKLAFHLVILFACSGLVGRSTAFGKDFFLTIGGGYNPNGNQVSLEKNVVFLQKVLGEQRPDHPSHDIYFADGRDPSPDVQFRDPKFRETCPPARRIMAELFGDPDTMDLRYRNNEIVDAKGPADLNVIRRRMRELSRELKAGDRLIVYATGHGGPAEGGDEYRFRFDSDKSEDSQPEYNQFDSSLFVWDRESVSASEFAGWLDRMPKEVTVVLVMVQCYAGGFAHTIFHEADADLGLSPHPRCGFFAQLHDRAASGCTPDINEADYQEYSSFFWAALAGRSRNGEPVTSADYDSNGHVNFLEAHAYAVIESNTIDIPVTTSAALLRKHSRLGKEKVKSDSDSSDDNPIGRLMGMLASSNPTPTAEKVVELKGPLAKLAERARPDQRATILQLSDKLKLNSDMNVEAIRRRLEDVKSKSMVASAKVVTTSRTYESALERVQEQVRELWPELGEDFSPLAMELASDRAVEFVRVVTALPGYEAVCKARELQRVASNEQLDVERTEAKLQRLLRTCEDVVLAANLPAMATPDIVQRYEQLMVLESGSLSEAKPAENR